MYTKDISFVQLARTSHLQNTVKCFVNNFFDSYSFVQTAFKILRLYLNFKNNWL